jgi:hypothetical protein
LHRTLRERPIDRLEREREALRPLPAPGPELDRRSVLRVPPQPYARVDRNDYSLDPRLVGQRVELRVSQREVIAVALDTGELAASHRRVFAAGQEITDPATGRRSSACGLSAIAAGRWRARTSSSASCRSMTDWRHRWASRPSSRTCSGR